MRKITIVTAVWAVVAFGGSVALADTVGIVDNVTINEVKVVNGKLSLVYANESGRTVEKDLGEVKAIKITACPDFEKGVEKLSSDPAAALKTFDACASKMTGKWQRPLLQYYRSKAASAAGQVGRATEDWAALAVFCKYDKVLLDLMPAATGAKGSEDNKKALAALSTAESGSASNAAFVLRVRQQLKALYEAEGNDAKVKEYNKKIGNTESQVPDNSGGSSNAGTGSGTPTPVGGGSGSLAQAYNDLAAKQYDRVIVFVNKNLKLFSSTDLPTALYYLGKAQLGKYQQDSKDRTLAQEAGLNFMRVYTFYPTSSYAGESLYEAAMANLALGNKQSAAMALNQLRDYCKTKPGSEALNEKADKALQEMK